MWATRQLSPTNHATFLRDARDYALLNGMVIRYDCMSNDNCVGHVPFTLFPSPYPRKLYQECLEIQPIVNKLMLKIANDTDFINSTLRPIAQVDDFTKNLLDINDTVRREGLAQPKICCINRADYMLDVVPNAGHGHLRVRQVEMNAISAAMSAHSVKAAGLQEFLLHKYGLEKPTNSISPNNKSISLVAGGIIDAFDAYGSSSAVVMLVNEKRSINFSDQFMIELEVCRQRPDVKVVRKSFMSLPLDVKLGPNKELLIDGSVEVAVVYFRYGYDPSNYDFDKAWDVRLLLERSRAIKCPSINFHLSGAKKFQQVLDSQHELERFLEPAEAKRLGDLFSKFWSFDGTSGSSEGYQTAMKESVKLVLKPQREGGGHNTFGADVKPFLQKLKREELTNYILMEYIDSPREKNWILMYDDDKARDSTRLLHCDQLVSELGIFGSILADAHTSEVISNESAGYLVRSKKFGVNEGGVASGYAGISNLLLLDDDQVQNNFALYYEQSVE